MESHFDVKIEHLEVTKMLIRRYESFRFIVNPVLGFDSYRFSIKGAAEHFNEFHPIYEEMVRRNWTHEDGCGWATLIPPLSHESHREFGVVIVA